MTLDAKDQFATEFVITNSGSISIRHVEVDCMVDAPPSFNHVEIDGSINHYPVPEIKPGDKITRKCGMSARSLPNNATIQFLVSYRTVWGSNKYTAGFRSHFDVNGIPRWFPDSE